jgi:uroporphyrinogen-III synthase
MPILVTRPVQEAQRWVGMLQEHGCAALALPLIEILPAPQPQAVAALWQRLDSFDAVMFVSANAIAQFFALRPAPSSAADAAFTSPACQPRAYVTGPASAAALRKALVDPLCVDGPDAQSPQFDSEALWDVVRKQVQPGFRLLVVRGAAASIATPEESDAGGQGRDWFSAQVRAAGGSVQTIASYQRAIPVWTQAERELARAGSKDGSVWLFSSSEAVENLCQLCPDLAWQQARAVATHPRIAQAARAAGFGVVCESRPVLHAIVASIESIG